MEVATTAHGDIERLDRGRLRIEEHIDARRRAGGEHDVRAAADPGRVHRSDHRSGSDRANSYSIDNALTVT